MAVAQYIYAGSGAPVAERRSGTTRAYQFDGMRSTRQLVDSDGNVTDTFGFDLLGNARTRTGSTPTPFTWNLGAGKTTAASGQFFQARRKPGHYGPSAGWGTAWDTSGGFDNGWVQSHVDKLAELLDQVLSGFIPESRITDERLLHATEWPVKYNKGGAFGGVIIIKGYPGPSNGAPDRGPSPRSLGGPTVHTPLPHDAPCAVERNDDPCDRPPGRDMGVKSLKLAFCAARCHLGTIAPKCFDLLVEGVSTETILSCILDLLKSDPIDGAKDLALLFKCLLECTLDPTIDPGNGAPYRWQYCSTNWSPWDSCDQCCENTARGPSKTDCYTCCTDGKGAPRASTGGVADR